MSDFKVNALKEAIIPRWIYEININNESKLYYARGSETIYFKNNAYLPTGIEHGDITNSADTKSNSLNIAIQDATGELSSIITNYDLSDVKVNISLLLLEFDSESGTYKTIDNDDNYNVDFRIGSTSIADAENSRIINVELKPFYNTAQPIPRRKFTKESCNWKFKSEQCGYTGTDTCDYTFNKCRALGNTTRFGGFPGVPGKRIRII